MPDQLSPYQTDALIELWNMAINQAAGKLSELVGKSVLLAIPNLRMLDIDGLRRFLELEVGPSAPCINQAFDGGFAGDALLIYPHASGARLAAALLGEDKEVEALSSAAQSALIEVGNIMLNACIGAIGEVLGMLVTFDLPDIVLPSADIIGSVVGRGAWGTPAEPRGRVIAFLLESAMTVEGSDISGYIAIALDGTTATKLVERMEERWLR